MNDLHEENRRLRKDVEQRFTEIAGLAERLDQVALASEARDQSWLDELDTIARDFEDERRRLLAALSARDVMVEESAAREASLAAQLAEATQFSSKATAVDPPLPPWRPAIKPFRSSRAA